MTKSNRSEFFKKNISPSLPPLQNENSFTQNPLQGIPQQNLKICEICLTDETEIEQSKWIELDCGHNFCRDCLTSTLKVAQEKRSLPLKCPSSSAGADGRSLCLNFVDAQKFSPLFFPESDQLSLNQRLNWEKNELLSILNTLNMYPCQRPDCLGGKILTTEEKKVLRDHKCLFCLACLNCGRHHCQFTKDFQSISPIPINNCGISEDELKISNPQAFQNLQIEFLKNLERNNLRFCPQCFVFTERIEGCNKITCSNCQKIWHWDQGNMDISRYMNDRGYTFSKGEFNFPPEIMNKFFETVKPQLSEPEEKMPINLDNLRQHYLNLKDIF
jgi:hypothetical protein